MQVQTAKAATSSSYPFFVARENDTNLNWRAILFIFCGFQQKLVLTGVLAC